MHKQEMDMMEKELGMHTCQWVCTIRWMKIWMRMS